MSLWRKRGTSDTNRDTIAPNVHHNEQNAGDLVNILNKLHDENVRLGLYEGVYDLSIKSEDLSIKREKAMREVQRLGQEIEQEPVALKLGECWPENVMQMWDYYRKEIANGNTGSEPRDWFESLAEMRLVDTTPPQRKPLTDEEILTVARDHYNPHQRPEISFARAIEAAHNIKE